MNLIVITIVSFLIIVFGHYLWQYILDKCTIKKVKSLDQQTEKYKTIINDIYSNTASSNENVKWRDKKDYIADDEKIDMINELNDFMMSL